MLKDSKRGWLAIELASELKISVAWAARVLATLQFDRLAERDGKGAHGRVYLSNIKNLMARWKLNYHFGKNTEFPYRILTKNPASTIDSWAKKEVFRYAVTGKAVDDLKKGRVTTPPLYVYISPKDYSNDIHTLLDKLENKYDILIPTHKNPNLIVLEPHVGEGVFFDATVVGGITCVSDLQIELDTHNMAEGAK